MDVGVVTLWNCCAVSEAHLLAPSWLSGIHMWMRAVPPIARRGSGIAGCLPGPRVSLIVLCSVFPALSSLLLLAGEAVPAERGGQVLVCAVTLISPPFSNEVQHMCLHARVLGIPGTRMSVPLPPAMWSLVCVDVRDRQRHFVGPRCCLRGANPSITFGSESDAVRNGNFLCPKSAMAWHADGNI